MAMSDDLSRWYDALNRRSVASSSILVALAVVIVTILLLFEKSDVGSFAWYILTITYGLTCIAGFLIFKNWAVAEISIWYFFNQKMSQDNAIKQIEKIIGDSKIREFFFSDQFRNKDLFHFLALVTTMILAGLLWLAFAFKMYHV